MSPARLLVFGRAPEPGRAKTRMIPLLGEAGAARLATALLDHSLTAAAEAARGSVELWHAGEDTDGVLVRLARRTGADVRRQPEGNLGHRMATALAEATTDGAAGLLVAGDCPYIGCADLVMAIDALARHDAVLAPATDGGYVLLGAHAAPARLFEGLEWGGCDVAAATRQRFRELGWSWFELPPRSDIDRPADLVALSGHDPTWRHWLDTATG